MMLLGLFSVGCLLQRVICFPSMTSLKKPIFHCKWLSISDCFWVRDGVMCSLLSALGVHLVWTCAGPGHCEFIWAPALLCLKGPDSLLYSVSPVLFTLFCYFLGSGGMDLMQTSYLVFQGLSLSAYCLATCLCICSHLLQEEAFLLMAEQGIDL